MKNKLVLLPIFILLVLIFILGYLTRGLTTKQEKSEISGNNFDIFTINDDYAIMRSKSNLSILPDSTYLEQEPSNLKEFLVEYYSSNNGYNYDDICLNNKVNCSIDNSEFKFTPIDLNNDKEKEYIIMPIKACGCSLRGASGNGDILVVKKSENTWDIVGHLNGNAYNMIKKKTNGFYDILTNSHSSAFSGVETVYKWTDKSKTRLEDRYEEVFSKWYRLK